MNSTRRTALIFGVLFLATFVFSIGGVILYDPVLNPADFIAGTGGDTRVRLGVFCEVLLIVANVGMAVVVFPIPRRQNETLALGYVTARLVECPFIAVGVVSLLTVVTLRQKAGARTPARSSRTQGRSSRFVIGRSFSARASSSASGTG
jgi:hypothetical protein